MNRELEVLEIAIEKAAKLLKKGGRLCIITFHSLEDRIVKNKFKDLATACKCPIELPLYVEERLSIKLSLKKPIVPSAEELKNNKRAHSSKLRVLEKL